MTLRRGRSRGLQARRGPGVHSASGASARPRTELVLRVVPMPADLNPSGDVFGGWIMSMVDIAGAVPAIRVARSKVATVAVDSLRLQAQPVSTGDIASFTRRGGARGAHLDHRGRRGPTQRHPENPVVVKVTRRLDLCRGGQIPHQAHDRGGLSPLQPSWPLAQPDDVGPRITPARRAISPAAAKQRQSGDAADYAEACRQRLVGFGVGLAGVAAVRACPAACAEGRAPSCDRGRTAPRSPAGTSLLTDMAVRVRRVELSTGWAVNSGLPLPQFGYFGRRVAGTRLTWRRSAGQTRCRGRRTWRRGSRAFPDSPDVGPEAAGFKEPVSVDAAGVRRHAYCIVCIIIIIIINMRSSIAFAPPIG